MKYLPHFPGNYFCLIKSAYEVIFISSDIFANKHLVLETYDEVDTVLGDVVCTMLVIEQS